MSTTERLTVTLPAEMLVSIDHFESNRSRFVTEAVRREIERRRRDEFRLSLENPHPETVAMAREPLADWVVGGGDDADLVDPDGGTAIRWVPDVGWVSEE
jgi:hypothetical protein